MAGGWGNTPSMFSKQAKGDVNKQMRFLALSILRSLTSTSPVDTGRFVNNWVVGLGVKDNVVFDDADPGRNRALARGDKVLNKHKDLSDIWISNNLPYGQRLNEGWSGQAPASFVQSSIQRAVNQYKRLKR